MITAEVLANLTKSGRLTPQDRRWITQKITEDREFQMQIALLNAFAKDPELKYFVGMAGGAGVAWVGAMLNTAGAGSTGSGGSTDTEGWDEKIKDLAYGYLAIQSAGLTGIAILKGINWQGGDGSGTGGLAGQIGNILALGGTSFAGTCAMILILKSIFNGTDLGELLAGVGEIIPL